MTAGRRAEANREGGRKEDAQEEGFAGQARLKVSDSF